MLTAIKLELCTVKLLARNQYEFFLRASPVRSERGILLKQDPCDMEVLSHKLEVYTVKYLFTLALLLEF